jgi:hypothetical protein
MEHHGPDEHSPIEHAFDPAAWVAGRRRRPSGIPALLGGRRKGVAVYTDFMVVGIDTEVLCCESCGALVPHDRRQVHDNFHARAAAQVTEADHG